MTASVPSTEMPLDAPRYARFSRRLRGIAIDFMLFLATTVVALQLATAFNDSDISRAVGFGFVAAFLLYEPLLVWLTGGTVGHHLSNLRVVDDRTNGNVGLLKAFGRVAVKFVLSWWSFVIMTAARRHQAVHDLLTRSTVQIRDPAKALPSHFSHERVGLSGPGMPSRGRRIVVIVGYVIATYVAMGVVAAGLGSGLELLSSACLAYSRCTSSDDLFLAAGGLAWLIVVALCIGWGWQGRLWGARRRVAEAGT